MKKYYSQAAYLVLNRQFSCWQYRYRLYILHPQKTLYLKEDRTPRVRKVPAEWEKLHSIKIQLHCNNSKRIYSKFININKIIYIQSQRTRADPIKFHVIQISGTKAIKSQGNVCNNTTNTSFRSPPERTAINEQ